MAEAISTDDTEPPTQSPFAELTSFQIDILCAIPRAEPHESGDVPHGLAVVEYLDSRIQRNVGSGAFYPNVAELDDRGLIERVAIDDRSKGLCLTDDGRDVLVDILDDVGDALHAAEDGTREADQ